MDIELYDCPYCNTSGVLPTSDDRCPSCRHPLVEKNRRASSACGAAVLETHEADTTSWRAGEEERRARSVGRGLCIGMTVVGAVGLLLTPVVLVGTALAGGERDGAQWQVSTKAADRAIEWAATCLLASWAVFEAGFAMSRARLIIQILVRIPLYGFIILMLLVLAIGTLLNNCTFP
ncbi:MAG: hypothetical protein KBE65_23110 [Phycisphaerae bacterium]|nr:hypothetical protein [Phycisphaerae bacterium]